MQKVLRLTTVEVRRALNTRGSRWAFIITIGAGIALGLAVPGGTAGTFESFVSTVSLGLPLLVGMLAVMVFTADWGTRAALVTFVLTPRRSRVIAARYLAVLALTVGSLVAIHIIAALVFLFAHVQASGTIVTAGVARQFASMLGTTIASALTAMAVGGLVLRTAPALVVAVFAPFVLTIALAFTPAVLLWANPYGLASWLADPVLRWMVDDDGGAVGFGPALTSFVIWTAVPLVLGWFRQLRAEPR
jgi:ABC-2 type transport system permease protein